MLIFAIIGLPAFFFILKKKIEHKDIILFFLGVVFSSVLSILMWSLGTFYSYYSDQEVYKVIKMLIIQCIPLFILYVYVFVIQIKAKKIKIDIVAGFLYWNLLFSLLMDIRINNQIQIILLPLLYMFVLYLQFSIERISFIYKNDILKLVFFVSLPFIIFLFQVFSIYSNMYLILFVLILLITMIILKLNIGGLKGRIISK